MKQEVSLKEIALHSKGQQINGDELMMEGKYSYLNGGINPSGNWDEYNVLGNSVAISEGGNSCGYVNYMKEPFWCGAHCYYLYNVKGNVKYLYYVLKSQQSRIMKLRSGACMPNIKKGDLAEFRFTYDFDEQEQASVVEVLDSLSCVINLKKEQLLEFDNLIKSRFVELFGLPVSNTKGWRTEHMEDVAPVVNYVGKFDNEVWLLNLDMVEAQTGRILDYLIVSEDEVGNSTCTFDTSNVLYSKLRPYLNKVVIPDRCGYATSELVPLQPVNTKINREYLAFMLRSDEFVNMINEKVAGAKMPRVSMGEFRTFDVPIPPMEIQGQFTDFVHQIDKLKFLFTISQRIYKEGGNRFGNKF